MTTNLTSRRGGGASSPGKPEGAGFQGQIAGASLSDLVQMECLAGSRGAFRVISGSDVGHLFFRGGSVVYALAGSLTGEAAALEILSWHEGTFQAVDREWPVKDAITCSWQTLLLRAAQAQDELAAGITDRRPTPGVIAMRSDGRARPKPGQDAMDSIEFDVTPVEVGGHTLRSEDFAIILRLSATGAVVVNHGATQDFADVVAYACRLSELVGMLLGVDRFIAMECTFKSGRCFMVLEDDGQVVALGPRPSVDLATLRELLGT